VRSIASAERLEAYVQLSAAPNFPVLGRKFGPRVPKIAEAIKALDTAALISFLARGAAKVAVAGETVELGREDMSASVKARDGFGAREERGLTVIVDLRIDDDLRLEGAAREVINRLQNLRKSAGYEVTDRIRLRYAGGAELERVFTAQRSLIAAETLADDVAAGRVDWNDAVAFDLDGVTASLWIQKSR
jgi:isoleucyl-tRNA synthetase